MLPQQTPSDLLAGKPLRPLPNKISLQLRLQHCSATLKGKTNPIRKLNGSPASVVEGPSPPTAAGCPGGTLREDPPYSNILFAEFFAGTAELTRTLRGRWGRM